MLCTDNMNVFDCGCDSLLENSSSFDLVSLQRRKIQFLVTAQETPSGGGSANHMSFLKKDAFSLNLTLSQKA